MLQARIGYKDFSKDYLFPMVELANLRFGDNYINTEDLLSYITERGGVCTLAVDEEDKLLGFCLFYGETFKNISEQLKISKEEMLSVIKENCNLCVAKSIVLAESAQGMGIADNLLKINLEKAKNKGYDYVFAAAWDKGGGDVPAKNVSVKNGFKFLKTSSMVWINYKNYKCVICNGPCRCNAEIYYRAL